MVRRFAIGDVVITSVADVDPFEIALSRIMPSAIPAELVPFRNILAPDYLDETLSTIRLAIQTFLVQVDGKNILIDTCVGEQKHRPRLGVWNERQDTNYLRFLAEAGIPAETIDVVFCTHLHADHVGWNTMLQDGRWVPTFRNATYLFGRTDFMYWEQHQDANHGSFVDSVLPIAEAGQMTLVDDGYSLARGLTLLPLPGHSPGQMGLIVDRGQERALFCGDAIHSPLQIFKPDWSSAFCADPTMAVASRRRILQDAAEDGRLLVPAHFRGCGCVRIRHEADDFRPIFADETRPTVT